MRWMMIAILLGGCGAARYESPGCRAVESARVAPVERGRRTRNVILVTIDGVRWQDVFEGVDQVRARASGLQDCEVLPPQELVPNLTALAEAGVALGAPGAAMVSSGPNFVSLPGYRELLTGRAGGACTHNLCGPIEEPTLLDELTAREHILPEQVALIASWERLERAAGRAASPMTISTGRHAGATRDRLRVTAEASALLDRAAGGGAHPGWLDYRPDRYTAPLALAYLSAKRPRFLHVALGDTDEHAHRGDYAGYLNALRAADRFIGELWATLAAMEDYGADTTVIVTTDHGRARGFSGHGGGSPESGRVWLIAAGGAVGARGRVHGGRLTRLADVAPTLRVLFGLPPDPSARAGAPLEPLVSPVPAAVLAARRD